MEWIDPDGRVLGVVSRRRMRAENLRHRSVGIVVLSSDGRLLVHRRSDTKDLRPGWWDVMAGGVVAVGETDDVAAERELAEELGIEDVVLEPLGTGRWDDVDSMEVCALYRAVHDGPYRFADGEVAEARLVTPTELALLRSTERFLPGSLAMVDEHLAAWFGRDADDAARLPCRFVQRVEFTIEPFVPGEPGPHVTESIAAVRALGHEVEIGPFGSSVTVPADAAGAVVAAVVDTAFRHGADHVNVDVEAVEG